MSILERNLYHESLPSPEKSTIPNISFGIYLPERILTNAEIEFWNVKTPSGKFLTANDILSKTGISKRYVANEEETPLFMAIKATENALAKHKGNIDAVIVSTSFPTGRNLSGELQNKFGINGYHLDVNAACSGLGLGLAHLKENEEMFISKNILLVGTEKYSSCLYDLRKSGINDDPSLSQTIFSDGAVATIFEYGKDLTVLSAKKTFFPNELADNIKMPIDKNLFREPFLTIDIPYWQKFKQDGAMVYKTMRVGIPELVKEIDMNSLSNGKVQMIIPHQGSGHMVDIISQQLKDGFPPVFKDIEEGNFSSASLLKAMERAIREGKLKKGRVLLVGFGAGLLAVSVDVMLG